MIFLYYSNLPVASALAQLRCWPRRFSVFLIDTHRNCSVCSASKRGKPCEHELPPHLVVGKPTLASSPGKDMRREDSSEAASAVTLTPPIPSLKSQQEASTCPVMYSHSAQSSQGCENTLPSLMLRELEILNCKLGFALLEVANRPAWEFVRDVLDESIASLLKSNETDTTRHRLTVNESALHSVQQCPPSVKICFSFCRLRCLLLFTKIPNAVNALDTILLKWRPSLFFCSQNNLLNTVSGFH